MKLNKLRELHDTCINHPFRLHPEGRTGKLAKSYADCMEEMHNEFIKQVKLSFKKSAIPYPFEDWIWSHQFVGCYYMLEYEWNHQNEKLFRNCMNANIPMLEHYLKTIHGFLNKNGELTEFWINYGYEEDNNSTWKENPFREFHVIYYPQLKRWELTKFHAKRELPFHTKMLFKAIKDKDKHPVFGEASIQYHKDRIKELKEVLRL